MNKKVQSENRMLSQTNSNFARPLRPLSWREFPFVITMGAMIFASSWLLGGRFPWAQWTLLWLGVAAFLTGLFSLSRPREHPAFLPWRGWWFSGAAMIIFVAYVAIQSLNISHLPRIEGNNCILTEIPYVTWLPSSVGGKFNGLACGFIPTDNASRYLLIYGAAALGGLAMIVGVQSLQALRAILWVILAHGVISAFVCIVHQMSGSTKVLWISGDTMAFLGAPFFSNKNQNAAYQTLLSGWMLATACRIGNDGRTTPRNIAVSLFVVAILGLASIRSRAGLVFAALLGMTVLWTQRKRWVPRSGSGSLKAAVCAVVIVFVSGLLLWKAGFGSTLRRLSEIGPSPRMIFHGDDYRMMLHRIALEMFKDRPIYGWGASGYFYTYAQYESRVPEMAHHRPGSSYYLLSCGADGDWYQFLMEFGVIGTPIFALIWIPHLLLWWRRRLWQNEFLIPPALAVIMLLYHGFIDQPFRNVGVLFLHLTSLALVTKCCLLDRTCFGHRRGATGSPSIIVIPQEHKNSGDSLQNRR